MKLNKMELLTVVCVCMCVEEVVLQLSFNAFANKNDDDDRQNLYNKLPPTITMIMNNFFFMSESFSGSLTKPEHKVCH